MRGSDRYVVQWRVQGRCSDVVDLVVKKPGEFFSTVSVAVDMPAGLLTGSHCVSL